MAEDEKKVTFSERLGSIDRRIIFLLIGLAVLIPIIVKYTTAIPTSPLVQNLFDKVESLPPGSKVLMSFDYGPSTVPENQPMANAFTRHCFENGHRV